MKLFKFIFLQILIIIIYSTVLYAEDTNISKNYYIITSGSGASRDEAIKIALREAVERVIGVFVYTTTSVDKFKLVKDEILTTTRGSVQDYDILKEEQSDKIYFITLKVHVKADEIKDKINRSKNAITYDNALKDYSLIQNKREKLLKYIELLKSINERPLMDRYSVDYSGYEVMNIKLKQTTIKLKAHLAINPFYWDIYYKILDLISEDCSQDDSVKLCTYLSDNPSKPIDQGKKYCVNRDIYPYLLHRTPVDLQFFLNKPKEEEKGFFGSSDTSSRTEKYIRMIGALDENLLAYHSMGYLQAEQFESLLRQKYIKSECIEERNNRWAIRGDACYKLGAPAISKMNSTPGVRMITVNRDDCNLSKAAVRQFFHVLDENGIEIGTEFIFNSAEAVKELPFVKVNIGLAETNNDIYFPRYSGKCEMNAKCIIHVK